MPYLRAEYQAGAVKEYEDYFSIRTPGKKIPRGKNRRFTSEQQQKLNNRNAVKKLTRIINANFFKNDIFATTDYEIEPLLPNGEVDMKKLKNDLRNFERRIKGYCKKNGLSPPKILAVIEQANERGRVRAHTHIILSKMSYDALRSLWSLGGIKIGPLDATREYKGLANYLSKDPTLGTNHQKRWSASQNLIIPKPKIRVIKRGERPPDPPKGFKEVMQREYTSDITGLIRYTRFIKINEADYARRILRNTDDELSEINSG